MALNLVKIQEIKVAMIMDRDVTEFHYIKVRIVTEQNLKYDLMISAEALQRFVMTFH